jgi:hypothetical protein
MQITMVRIVMVVLKRPEDFATLKNVRNIGFSLNSLQVQDIIAFFHLKQQDDVFYY